MLRLDRTLRCFLTACAKRFRRRERYPQEGMLLQIDGSRHDWLEGRGPYLTLIGAADDATGTVPFAHGCVLMLKEIIDRRGVPLSLEKQLRGRRDPTQFNPPLTHSPFPCSLCAS